MREFYGFDIPRYICSVFDEMRAIDKSKNYGALLGLIEEAQVLANRMEAKLSEYKDIERGENYIKKLKVEIKKLETKKESLSE